MPQCCYSYSNCHRDKGSILKSGSYQACSTSQLGRLRQSARVPHRTFSQWVSVYFSFPPQTFLYCEIKTIVTSWKQSTLCCFQQHCIFHLGLLLSSSLSLLRKQKSACSLEKGSWRTLGDKHAYI